MCTCKFCDKKFSSKYALAGHLSHCVLNPNYNEEQENSIYKKFSEAASKKNHDTFIKIIENEEIKYCLHCHKELDKIKAHCGAKFCNSSCAASYNNSHRKRTKKQNKKISNTLQQKYKNGEIKPTNSIYKSHVKISDDYESVENLIKQGTILNIDNFEVKYNHTCKYINTQKITYHKCEYCGKEFYARITKYGNVSESKTCCEQCKLNLSKLKGKETQKRLISEGKHKGWQSRNIISYAEKFWTKVLSNNNINYEREKVFVYGDISKEKRYFLDFYIEINGRKIDLEIDGKQHKYKNRFEHDKIRDNIIKSFEIEVYRIEWNEINSKEGSFLMKEKIDKFLKYINT